MVPVDMETARTGGTRTGRGARFYVVILVALAVVVFRSALPTARTRYTLGYASLGWVTLNLFVADAGGGNPRPLLANPNRDYNARFSTDGSWIVFTSERSGSADIYRVHPDGTGLERLTSDPAFDDQGTLSPDGHSLAFVSTRGGRANIWLLDLRTKASKNLTSGSSGDFRPVWSPDGQWIAFSSDRDSAHTRFGPFFTPLATDIYVMKRDGTGVRRMSSGGPHQAVSPTWAPDGREIACIELDPRTGAAALVAIDVATLARRVVAERPGGKWAPRWLRSGAIGYLDTEGIQRTDHAAPERAAANRAPTYDDVFHRRYHTADWSPDERLVVFARDVGEWPPFEQHPALDPQFQLIRTGIFPSFAPDGRHVVSNSNPIGGAAHNAIQLMNADGSHRTTLLDDPTRNALAPVWSPSGDRIAFGFGELVQTIAGRETQTVQLALMKPDGSDLQTLPMAGDHAGYPSWSPDGEKLVYVRFDAPNRGLWILNRRDRTATKLHLGADNFPSWSPVSHWVVFTSAVSGKYDIYKIRADGSGLTQLTRSPGNNAHPKWSPDGKWIAFASNRSGFKDETGGMSDGEIYVMRADGSDVTKLTENTFEDGTPAWAPLLPHSRR